MWNVNELIVLSDLHLAAERDTGSFQSDKELAECLHWILTETQDCTIVLAGDALDFLILDNCPSKRGFDRFSCHTKRIIEHHPEIFDALTVLAQSPRHLLVIMGGESDAEMILPQVQETIERRLGIDSTNPALRWLVHGEAFRVGVGQTVVLVEHGNALDPWNRIDHEHLQAVLALASRNLPEPSDYRPPLGIELVSRVIKDLRRQYRWIDCLKPASELILPLLWPIASEHQQIAILELLGRHESMKTEASIKRSGNAHDPTTQYQGEKEAERSPEDQVFKEWADAIYERHVGSVNSWNGDLIEKARLILKHTALEVDRPTDTIKCLQPVFNAGTDLIIHGHTHAAKTCVVGGAFYVNTGTWSQILRLPQSESNKTWQGFLERLRSDSADSFVRPTFVHVHKHAQPLPAGVLLEWRSSGPEILAAHQFADPRSQ